MFLVRDTQSTSGQLLALKILLPSLASNEDFLKMFFTEAKIASKLEHPNVVGIAGFGQVDGIYCLAMEYVFGASLAQVLRASARAKRPLTVGVLLRITAAVCDALHYAHELNEDDGQSLGLVHRDVTPQNILIGFNGAPKLTDFGIAKATNRGWETQAGIVKGKFSYMSPEQALGKKVDRRSDIFGTGIVLWEALTGRDLFKGSTPMEVLTAIREHKIQPPSKVVPGLTPIVDPIVMKALRRSPRQRYQTAAEMRDDIEDLIRRAGVSIDDNTISKEFAAIYGDTIVERAFALRAAMAGKGDLENLAKVLGGSVLEQKHLPTIRGGINDPDPLGLFSDHAPPRAVDNGFESALPARLDQSLAEAPQPASEEFEIIDPGEEDEDLLPFDSEEQAHFDVLVPPERLVNGWNDSTAMNAAPKKDDLLSMLSEEDATIGFLPPEFADRFGAELKQALAEEEPEGAHFDDELTIGMPESPELAELRAISEDPSQSGQWDDMFPEPAIPGAATEALPTSYGLRPVPRPGSNRHLPRAPSLDMTRPVPRAPSLDMDEATPVPRNLKGFDPTDEPPLPSRPPPKAPPPPPAPRPRSSAEVDVTDPIEDVAPPINGVPPLVDTDEVPSSMPGEVVSLDGVPAPAPTADSPAPVPPAPITPAPIAQVPLAQVPNGASTPELSGSDPLSPDVLRALADPPEAPSPAPISAPRLPPVELETPPPPQAGLRVSPAFLVLGALLLLALGAALGLTLAG